ncbi:hypothetical protein LUX34_23885 [Streptomyces werraensis]|nr:hypothetical protein [Streptomyces werraensis]
MTDQKAPEGPQERPEGGPAGLGPSDPLTGAQAGADSLDQPFASLGRTFDARGQRCTYSPADTPNTDCQVTATWHILWDHSNASRACDQHMATARSSLVFDDSHPIGPGCDWPIPLWDRDQKRCIPPAGPDTEAEAAVAHNAGPTVAECAEADRLWWTTQKHGE